MQPHEGSLTPRPSIPSIFLALLLLTPASPRAAEKLFVELEAPTEGVTIRSPVPLVELRGWAGTGRRGQHDVLIVIDRSISAWRPTGTDIDGDGRIGELRAPGSRTGDHPLWTTDAGDTIYRAEVIAAGKLIERMDPANVRMGLITFAGGGKVRAPLGSNATELADALYRLPQRGSESTNFKVAINRAIEEFERARPEDGLRHRSLMLLSDGFPATGKRTQEEERLFVRLAAKRAAEAGIRIYGFAVGSDAVRHPEAFQEMTRLTGGELLLVHEPGDVIDYIPYTSLTGIDGVSIDNLSTSAKARAVRVFPDGTFDAYAPLRPGPNVLRITVNGSDGDTHVVDRRVFYEKIPANSPGSAAESRRLLRELRIRTIETELAVEARTKRRRARWRDVEIQVE